MSTHRDKEEQPAGDPRGNRWPFDPMQPGDHEPARLPDHLEKEPTAPPTPQEKQS